MSSFVNFEPGPQKTHFLEELVKFGLQIPSCKYKKKGQKLRKYAYHFKTNFVTCSPTISIVNSSKVGQKSIILKNYIIFLMNINCGLEIDCLSIPFIDFTFNFWKVNLKKREGIYNSVNNFQSYSMNNFNMTKHFKYKQVSLNIRWGYVNVNLDFCELQSLYFCIFCAKNEGLLYLILGPEFKF